MNNREIKFRAWDTVSKQMIIDFCKMDDGRFYGYDDTNNYIGVGSEHIMQFTGLKDKNGKEIYEGDIVQDTMHGSTEKATIIFKNAMFGCDYRNRGFYKITEWIDYGIIVIGNIYETPELINL